MYEKRRSGAPITAPRETKRMSGKNAMLCTRKRSENGIEK
jgi:hypothetical protein